MFLPTKSSADSVGHPYKKVFQPIPERIVIWSAYRRLGSHENGQWVAGHKKRSRVRIPASV